MSSILDALNKLEQEKAQLRREEERANVDPVSATHDLVGRSVLRDRVTVRVSPATLLVVAGVAVVALIAISFTAAVVLFSREETPRTAAVLPVPYVATPEAAEVIAPFPPIDTPPAVVASPKSEAPITGADDATRAESPPERVLAARPPVSKPVERAPIQTSPSVEPPAAPAPEAKLPDATSAKVPIELESLATESTASPAAEAPKSEADSPDDVAESAPEPARLARRTEPLSPSRPRAIPGSAAPVATPRDTDGIAHLPVLTQTDVERYGLVQLKVNMPTPAGPANPQGSAILTVRETGSDGTLVTNRLKFYEGQNVQGTSLRVFKVEANGVGLEDMRSGKRYRLPF